MTSRSIAFVVLALAGSAFAGPGAAPAPVRARFATIESVRADLDRQERRRFALVESAKQDWRISKVDRYVALKTPEDFANPKRDVHVADLATWMGDKDAPLLLRERCRDALKSVQSRLYDPDLQIQEGRSKRAAFSLARLVPLLSSPDEVSRTLASDVLESHWHASDPDIQRYSPRDPKTWPPATAAWKKYFAIR